MRSVGVLVPTTSAEGLRPRSAYRHLDAQGVPNAVGPASGRRQEIPYPLRGSLQPREIVDAHDALRNAVDVWTRVALDARQLLNQAAG